MILLVEEELIGISFGWSDSFGFWCVQFVGCFQEEGFNFLRIVSLVNQVFGKIARGFMVVGTVGIL